jgi:MFS transporter, DHA1 family, inner membrane transport protein
VTILAADFAFLPWTSATFGSASIALAVWGMCGWGLVVSQQHRLVALNQRVAPLLLALNASVIYLAIGASSALGALLLRSVAAYDLPLVGAILIAAGGLMGELASRLIRHHENPMPARG